MNQSDKGAISGVLGTKVLLVAIVALSLAILVMGIPQSKAFALDEEYTPDWDSYSYDTFTPDYGYSYDTFTPDYYDYSYDTFTPDYGYSYDTFTPDYGYSYDTFMPDYGYSYDTFTPDYYSYSYDTFTPDYGCGSSCYSSGCGSSCYSTPCCNTYSPPTYSPPCCNSSTPPRYNPPTYNPPIIGAPGQPAHANANATAIANANSTNNNVNTNTNINNINIATPQYPIVYTPPVTPAPYCTITQAQSGGYGQYNQYNSSTVAYLSWTSQNATSAFLSGVGSVGISGSQNVYPTYTTTYTLTVYGQNGQNATCSTTVNMNTYIPPVVQQPYVALTQIPYTGFDFGPLGNSIYWLSLISFAVAGAYLMIYYKGGAFALAGSMIPARKKFAPIVAAKAPILVEKEAAVIAEHKAHPIVAALRKAGTIDTMAIVQSTNGSMPKIIIERN